MNNINNEEKIISETTLHNGISFRLTLDGVWYKEDSKKQDQWHLLCSYLEVLYDVRDENGENWSQCLKLIDKDGKEKTFIIPTSMSAGEGLTLREKLMSLGLRIDPVAKSRVLLNRYLASYQTDTKKTCFSKVGWYKGCYVLPHKVYSTNKVEDYIFQSDNVNTKSFSRKGTLKEWQENIGKYAISNPHLVFSISAALTAPVLSLLGNDNFGLHFSGSSSIGKTTALRVASSVWGNEINSWRTTDNATESICRNANDGLLLFDELSEVDANAADSMAYMLGNGTGKARANKHGEARQITRFKTLFLSTGEIGIQTKLYEKGKSIKAGQTVRFIEIPADAGTNNGIFKELHNFKNSKDLANHLREASTEYCGVVIDEWLQWLVENKDKAVQLLRETSKQWIDDNSFNSDSQVQRVMNHFSIIVAVGELAINLGLLPWTENEVAKAGVELLNAWLEQRGGADASESMEVITRLTEFINEHGSSRFESIVDNKSSDKQFEQKIVNKAGYKKRINEERCEYYIHPIVFKKHILEGKDAKKCLSELANKRYILKDSEGCYTQAKKTPNGLQRMYVVPSTAFSNDNVSIGLLGVKIRPQKTNLSSVHDIIKKYNLPKIAATESQINSIYLQDMQLELDERMAIAEEQLLEKTVEDYEIYNA